MDSHLLRFQVSWVAIAQIEQLGDSYDAVVWLTLPLTEIRTQEAIAQQLTKLCQSTCGVSIEQRRTLILMLGHRNLSILCFEGGSLKPQNSSSDGPGFWTAFERGARSIGVTPVDYTALLSALTTGKTQQISQARASLYDFTQAAEAVRQTYWQGVSSYLQDHLMNQLENVELDMIVSGGAAWVVRSQVQAYFDELGYGTSFTFADEQHYYYLTEIISQKPEASLLTVSGSCQQSAAGSHESVCAIDGDKSRAEGGAIADCTEISGTLYSPPVWTGKTTIRTGRQLETSSKIQLLDPLFNSLDLSCVAQ